MANKGVKDVLKASKRLYRHLEALAKLTPDSGLHRREQKLQELFEGFIQVVERFQEGSLTRPSKHSGNLFSLIGQIFLSKLRERLDQKTLWGKSQSWYKQQEDDQKAYDLFLSFLLYEVMPWFENHHYRHFPYLFKSLVDDQNTSKVVKDKLKQVKAIYT